MRLRHSVLGFIVMLAALPALAAGIDGKWNATVDGGEMGPVELSFDFKADGEKLTGNLSMAMMPAPTPISDGAIKGEDVSFKLAFTMMEGTAPLVITYAGKIKGDEITMKSVFDMGQGATETQFIAKRAK